MSSKFSGLKALVSGGESKEVNPVPQAPGSAATGSAALNHSGSQQTNAAISDQQLGGAIGAPKDAGGTEREADGKKNANYYLPIALIDLIAQREYELKMSLPRASRSAFNKSVLVEIVLKQILGEANQETSNNLKKLVADTIIERNMNGQKAERITNRDL